MININKYPEKRVALFSPQDEFIDTLNECELLDIRCQLSKKYIKGYYVIIPSYGEGGFDEDDKIPTKYYINENGVLSDWENL